VTLSDGTRGRLPAMFLALFLAVSGGILVASPAQAHRDGCHRWHSCSSDSGSYACGDLGYTSECSGNTAPIENDFKSPSAPQVGHPLVTGRKVRMTVTAERGSRIEVWNASANVVTHATATGRAQTLSFTAPNGSQQRYMVMATDAADNISEISEVVAIDVDTIPPPITALSVTAPTPGIGAAYLNFTTGETATYDLTVTKTKMHMKGFTTSGATSLPMWLPNGNYRVTVTLRDKAGNISSASRALRVAVASPLLQVFKTSKLATSPVTFTVTGPERSTGTLTMADGTAKRFSINFSGQAVVSLPLADGAYAGPVVRLTDFSGRKKALTTVAFTVDTTSPSLKVNIDRAGVSHGRLSLLINTEKGAHVQSTISPGNTALLGAFTSTGTSTRLDHQIAAGAYTVRLVATDKARNVTIRTVRVEVVEPLRKAEWAALIAGALAFAVGVVWGWRKLAGSRSLEQASKGHSKAAYANSKDGIPRSKHDG
jgi:hypothetical protein